MCGSIWQTSNLRRLRLGQAKRRKKEEERRNQDENIMVCPIPQGDHKKLNLTQMNGTLNTTTEKLNLTNKQLLGLFICVCIALRTTVIHRILHT